MCASLVVPKILSPKIAMLRWMPRPVSPPPVAGRCERRGMSVCSPPPRSRSRGGRWRGAGAVLPDQVAGCRIERLNDAARIRQIHDAVVDERRRLLRAGVVHRPRPRELKLPDVLAGDLIERAVAPGVVGAPPVQPVAGRGIAQHRLGDRTEALDLRIEQETARHENGRNKRRDSHCHGASRGGDSNSRASVSVRLKPDTTGV